MESTAQLSVPQITISESAQAELLRLTAGLGQGEMIRIGVKGGGCSGLTYILDQSHPNSDDHLLKYGALTVVVSMAHALYLEGVVLDFGSGLDNRGFIFNNPNASSTCGCGTSFAI